ncbi:Uncharacterised protein [Mycobacterium tuberculosis]|uniref:Uncharacterized protein n=1 Tax=Mycobacterium tuberculosis TaxID=1773 RepID=A0A916L9F0_MYCTX|nr:Uncharacterised protein [Mycobacterium tuberculosis]
MNPRQRLAPIADYQMAGQGIHRVESDVVAVGDEGALPRRILDRGLYQCEVHRAVVVQDQKPVLASYDRMLHRVLDAVAARQHHAELRCRICRVRVTDLRSDGRPRRNQQIGVAASTPHREPEPIIGFVVNPLRRFAGP